VNVKAFRSSSTVTVVALIAAQAGCAHRHQFRNRAPAQNLVRAECQLSDWEEVQISLAQATEHRELTAEDWMSWFERGSRAVQRLTDLTEDDPRYAALRPRMRALESEWVKLLGYGMKESAIEGTPDPRIIARMEALIESTAGAARLLAGEWDQACGGDGAAS